MSTLFRLLVAAAVACAVAVSLDRPVAGETQAAGPAPLEVRDGVRALVSGSIPGALLFVRQGDRSYTVTAGSADRAGKVPMRAGDVFPIGSTTKTYTAVVVMHLVARGKLGLDDTVSKYLPDLLRYGNQITVRELLSHTSGLYDFADDPRFMAPYLAGKLGYAWTPRQMVGFAATKPLLFQPGTRFSYSNTNYVVLALLAERVGGSSYEQQLAADILRPLGLAHTSLPSGSGSRPDVHGYVRLGAAGKSASGTLVDTAALSPDFAWSAGGIRSTAQDEADFFRGLFSGKLLAKAQVAAMEETALTGGRYGLGIFPTGGNAYVWGSATRSINTTCGRAWGHGGAFPGYYQLPISSPDGSRQAVLLVNADETLLTQAQVEQVYALLDTAYCDGVGT